MIYDEIWIDVNKFQSGYAIAARRNEEQAQIKIIVTNEGKKISNSSYTLKFVGNNPIGDLTNGTATRVSGEEGAYLYTFTKENLAVSGKFKLAYFELYDSSNKKITSSDVQFRVIDEADMSADQATVHITLLDEMLNKHDTELNNQKQEFDEYSTQQKDEWGNFVDQNREVLESVDPGGTILKEIIDTRGEYGSMNDRVSQNETEINSKRPSSEPQASIDLVSHLRYQRETDAFCVPQGFCAAKENLLIAYNDYYLDNSPETENILLQEVDLSGKILREKQLRLGHGNGLAYRSDTNEILCTPGHILGVNALQIIVVDYSTLQIKRSITTSIHFTAIAYDAVSNRLWGKSGKVVAELDKTTYNIIRQFSITTDSIGQGLCANNDYLYIPLSNPENILVTDTVGNAIQNYMIPRYSTDNTYINELEGIAHVKENQFVTISFNFSSLSKKTTDTNVFFFNPISAYNLAVKRPSFSNYPNARLEFFVDAAYTGFDSDGTEEKPFKSLNQCFNSCANSTFMYVVKMKQGVYPFAEMSMCNNYVEIQGNGSVIQGLAFNRVSRIDLQNVVLSNLNGFALTIDNIPFVKLTNVSAQMDSGTKCFRFFDSQVTMDSCSVDGEGVAANNTRIYETNTTANAETAFSVSNRSTLNFTQNALQDKIDVGNGSAKLAVYPPTIVFSRSSSDNRLFGYAKINRKIFNEFLLTFNVGTTLMSRETINTRDTDSMVRFSEVANTAGDLIMYELRIVQTYDSKELLKDIQITESRRTTFRQDGTRAFTNWTSGAYPNDLPFISSVRVFS